MGNGSSQNYPLFCILCHDCPFSLRALWTHMSTAKGLQYARARTHTHTHTHTRTYSESQSNSIYDVLVAGFQISFYFGACVCMYMCVFVCVCWWGAWFCEFIHISPAAILISTLSSLCACVCVCVCVYYVGTEALTVSCTCTRIHRHVHANIR